MKVPIGQLIGLLVENKEDIGTVDVSKYTSAKVQQAPEKKTASSTPTTPEPAA